MAKLNLFDLFNKNKGGNQQVTATSTTAASAGQDRNAKTPAQVLADGMMNVRDIISPSAIEVDFNTVRIGTMYYRTIFVSGYPRFVGANWLSPVINFDHSLDISMFYYPVKSKAVLEDLRRKITELEATMASNREKGRISDPVVSAALEDAQSLQDQLVKGVEKYFQFSFYITVPADSIEELNNITSKLESILGSLLLISKVASLQMEEAFQSTVPAGVDKLMIVRNMDTTSLATTFPFTSSDLTMEEGIMYGINRHNGSLVIFDRFSLENANSVIFAKSGSGKSYFVKLEALRHIVFGAEVLVIDPEEEYRDLCAAVGGNYIDFSANSTHKINPFDLSGVAVEGENELGNKLLSLITLLKLMVGGLNPTEEALLDRALIETYRIKGISPDPESQMSREPPVMEDLYKVLMGADEPEAKGIAERLEKFIKGSMAGIFDYQSNINLESKMTVFSTKNLKEELRPIAFYLILDFIWTRIRKDLRKRILIVEEAWYLMANKDSAQFIYGIAKRARKYYLGLTTISQDVDDFLTSEYGKAIVTNSSIQVLLKQSPAAIDKVAETFYLSEGEKRLLLAADVGEGLFFAGANHVAIKVMASQEEHKLITTNPEEIIRLREQGLIKTPAKLATPSKPVYKQYKPPAGSAGTYTTMDASGAPKEGYGVPTSTPAPVSPSVPPVQPVPTPVQAPTPAPFMSAPEPMAGTPERPAVLKQGDTTVRLPQSGGGVYQPKEPAAVPTSAIPGTPLNGNVVKAASQPEPASDSIPTDEIMKAVLESVRAEQKPMQKPQTQPQTQAPPQSQPQPQTQVRVQMAPPTPAQNNKPAGASAPSRVQAGDGIDPRLKQAHSTGFAPNRARGVVDGSQKSGSEFESTSRGSISSPNEAPQALPRVTPKVPGDLS